MRYYEVHIPGNDDPIITTNARALRELPDGTCVYGVITEPDGSLMDWWELTVENGRVKFPRRRQRSIHSQRPWRANGRKEK